MHDTSVDIMSDVCKEKKLKSQRIKKWNSKKKKKKGKYDKKCKKRKNQMGLNQTEKKER